MAVYVDNFQAHYRGMIMCHIIADTRQELFEMVDKIGVHRKWIQEFDNRREYYDICLAKKKLAIEFGAKEINMRELATMTANRNMDNYLTKPIIMTIEEIRKLVEPLGFEYEEDFVFASPLSCSHDFKGCKTPHDVLKSIYDTGRHHGYCEGYEEGKDGAPHQYYPEPEAEQAS